MHRTKPAFILSMLLLVALFSLSGCVTSYVADQTVEVKNIGGNEGIVVVSLRQETTRNFRYSNVSFYFRDMNRTIQSRVAYFKGSPLIPSASSKPLKIYTLPAGQYEFFGYSMFIGSPVGTTEFKQREEFSIPFTVKPGQVTYLGEIRLVPVLGRNIFGIAILGGGYFVLSDQRQLDMVLLRQDYPNLASSPVEFNPIRSGNAPEELVRFR